MIHYLIEFRFHGKVKLEIKKLVYEINKKFEIGYKKSIPHITLAGPFRTDDEGRLISDFNRLCSKSPLMNFEINGFSIFENNKVVFLNVKSSRELAEFRWKLSQTLRPYCQLNQFDHKKDFTFHSTIALKIPEEKLSDIRDYLSRKSKLRIKHIMVRATLLKGGYILREYDFLLRKSLNRSLALNKVIYAQTLDQLKVHFGSKN